MIKLHSFFGDSVLDPFLGSGTTVKAAYDLGREGIGYELNKDYYLAYNNLGSLFSSKSDLKNAEKLIQKAIDLNPKFELGYINLGVIKGELNKLEELSHYFPVFIAENTSILMSLMKEAAVKTKKILQKRNFSLTVNEKHHKDKIDIPSGTAIKLCEALNIDSEKVKSTREGDNESYHEVIFQTNNGDKLQIKHSGNRSVYAFEVLNIAKWFYQKPKNLYYMQTLIEDLHE